jgi:hypothetical protein
MVDLKCIGNDNPVVAYWKTRKDYLASEVLTPYQLNRKFEKEFVGSLAGLVNMRYNAQTMESIAPTIKRIQEGIAYDLNSGRVLIRNMSIVPEVISSYDPETQCLNFIVRDKNAVSY